MRNAFFAMEFTTTREVLASLYEQTPIATLLCDRDGRILAANDAALQLSGRERQELVGHTCGELFARAAHVADSLADAFAGEHKRFDAELVCPGMTPIHVECDVFPVRLAGTITAAFVQARPLRSGFTDTYTGLPSRVLLNDRIEQCITMARRYQHGFALMYVRADAGEPAEVAEQVRAALRESDTLARVDARTFAVLQPMIEDAEDAADLARKVRLAEVRVGVALFPDDGESVDALSAAAQRDRQASS